MPARHTHIVFIHGLWLHAMSWGPWARTFAEHGFVAHQPGWPGEAGTVEESRANPDAVADFGIEEVTEHFRRYLRQLPEQPVIIGHSFGGMIAEKLLGEGYGVAAVAIDAAQIKGVLPLPLSSLRSTLPVFKNPANKSHAVALKPDEFRYAFGNAIPREECDALYEAWTVPSPARPLFEAAGANFSAHSPAEVHTENEDRGPLLLIMGGRDHTVPEAITKATLKQYRHSDAVTELLEFADRGHSLTIDSGWPEIADAVITWLAGKGLVRASASLTDTISN